MRALLLAAGKGTRLNQVTKNWQKCLLPIHGIPLIEYWLYFLNKCGVENFLINTHYQAEQVHRYFEQHHMRKKITLSYEQELLYTGGTIKANQEFLGSDEPFFVVHADNLCFCEFEKFISHHQQYQHSIFMSMMTFTTSTPQTCGIVTTDENNIVIDFQEKVPFPNGNIANGAVYIMNPSLIEVLNQIPKQKIDLSTEIIPKLLGKILSFHNEFYLRDIGNAESYALAQKEMLALISNGDTNIEGFLEYSREHTSNIQV